MEEEDLSWGMGDGEGYGEGGGEGDGDRNGDGVQHGPTIRLIHGMTMTDKWDDGNNTPMTSWLYIRIACNKLVSCNC